MNFNNENELEHFLHGIEAEMRRTNAQALQFLHIKPVFSILQKARTHEAFYRLDLVETTPQLRVLLPIDEGPIKFNMYLVQLSDLHPLSNAFTHYVQYQGSTDFEQERPVTEWHLLYSIGEMMKNLFWMGLETSRFPLEITVHKLL